MSNNLWHNLAHLDAAWTRRLSIADQPSKIRNAAAFFAHSGDSWFILLALGLIWLIGNSTWKALVVSMAAGIVLTAAVVFLMKFTIRRRRPDGDWGRIYRMTDPHSFPSGHAARAGMMAVVGIGLGPLWLGVLLLLWAPLVILARVAMGVHYLSDVIAGALVGIAMGLITLQFSQLLIN